MRRLLISLVFVALAAPSAALAGGWATAGLSAPPDDIGPGDTWNARITILQHGETPLAGAEPTLTIRSGATERTFKATPTDETGVYSASVVFPTSGKWSYEVYDGFTQYGGAQTHTFAPVQIGPGGGGGLPFFAIIGLSVLALGAITIIYLFARRLRVRAPAPAS